MLAPLAALAPLFALLRNAICSAGSRRVADTRPLRHVCDPERLRRLPASNRHRRPAGKYVFVSRVHVGGHPCRPSLRARSPPRAPFVHPSRRDFARRVCVCGGTSRPCRRVCVCALPCACVSRRCSHAPPRARRVRANAATPSGFVCLRSG